MPTVPRVNATGGGINPQIGVLLERMVGSRPAPVYDPPGLTAEAAAALGARPAKRRVPVEQRAQQTVSLAEMLAATRSLPASERAAMQRRILADPRAWEKGEWLD